MVEECTKSIVNKLLHGCMAALRCDGTDPEVHISRHPPDAMAHLTSSLLRPLQILASLRRSSPRELFE